jgi:hypothetical protein
MSSTPNSATDAVPAASVPERRRNAALRALIDEMLFQVRGMQNDQQAWSPDERAKAEAELARIMGRVRDAAARPPGEPEGGSPLSP